jgi:hypothetical protein
MKFFDDLTTAHSAPFVGIHRRLRDLSAIHFSNIAEYDAFQQAR